VGVGRVDNIFCEIFILLLSAAPPCQKFVWSVNGRGRLLVSVVTGGHCVLHHCSTTLGRGHIVGSLVGRGMGSKTPTAGSHGQTRAVVAKRMEVGWSVVDGWRGGVRSWSLSAWAAHGAAHGVVTCRRALVVLSWAGACRAGVVVVHIATMRAAVVPVFETLDRRGGVAGDGTVSATVCAAATVVAAAAASVCVPVATIVATAAAVRGLLIATVVVSTTTVVASASVAATTTVVAAALLSAATSATWALLVVDDTRGGWPLPRAWQSIWSCPWITLMLAVLDWSDSWMAAYAVPKFAIASVRDAVSSLSFANPMPVLSV
jgi:hypothetical protein